LYRRIPYPFEVNNVSSTIHCFFGTFAHCGIFCGSTCPARRANGTGKTRSTGGKTRSTGGKTRSTGGKTRSTGGKTRSTSDKIRSTGDKTRSTGG